MSKASMNFRTLDLNLLRIFDAVMSEGSLTAASKKLAITQPAASHALKRLHEALGEQLFVRHAHGMFATAKAEALWPQVRGALAALQQALAPEGFDARRQAVTFRLAMTDAGAALLTPAMVCAIEQQGALCNLRVLPLTTSDPRRLIQQGEADAAVGHFPEAVTALLAADAESTLRHVRLFDTRFVGLMRRGHPLSDQPLSLDAYCAARHLLASATGRAQGYVDQTLTALGRQRRVVLTVNQYFTAGRVLTRSDLLTVLPLAFVPATGHEEQLLVRELPFDLGPMQITLMWHMRRDAEPAHLWLRSLVQQAAQAALGPGGSAPA
jgi:DNA-binding transcriptional LysR family regulator